MARILSRVFTVINFTYQRKFWQLLIGLISVLSLSAQVKRLDSAPVGRLESGAPPFAIFGAAELSMSFPPTDVHLMPDGRILLFAARQIMLGDGVRWQAFQQAPEAKTLPTLGVAVNQQGQIYLGAPGGFSRESHPAPPSGSGAQDRLRRDRHPFPLGEWPASLHRSRVRKAAGLAPAARPGRGRTAIGEADRLSV